MSELHKEETKAGIFILIIVSIAIFVFGGIWSFIDSLAIGKNGKSILIEGRNMSEYELLNDFLQDALEYNHMRLKEYGDNSSMGKCAQSRIHLLEQIIEIKKRDENGWYKNETNRHF